MPFQTILIDDEPLALERLARLLEPHRDQIRIIAQADNGPEAVEQLDSLEPDLIFLDIQMPGMDGFEVLNAAGHHPLVIFSTAYDEYAVKAFAENSVDYLLKPVDPQRLHQAIKKLGRLTDAGQANMKRQIKKLLDLSGHSGKTRITVRVGDVVRFIDAEEIHFFRARDKYVEVKTAEESFLVSKPLNQLEKELGGDDFVRIHRSALVNMKWIKKVRRLQNGNWWVEMQDRHATRLPVSRNSKSKLGL